MFLDRIFIEFDAVQSDVVRFPVDAIVNLYSIFF